MRASRAAKRGPGTPPGTGEARPNLLGNDKEMTEMAKRKKPAIDGRMKTALMPGMRRGSPSVTSVLGKR